jgi:hypothetical protein
LKDLLSPTLANKLEGWLVLAIGIVTLIGAISVLVMHQRGSRVWGEAAVTGSIVSTLSAVGLAVMQLANYRSILMLLWVVLAALCGWCVWRLIRAGVRIPSHPGKLAALISIPTVLSALNFAYPNIYKPSVAPYFLNVTAEFGEPVTNGDGTAAALPLTLKMSNPSDVRVYVVASSYRVLGRKAIASKHADAWKTAVERREPIIRQPDGRFQGFSYQLLQADLLTENGDYFEPRSERSTTRIIELPTRPEYDVVIAQAGALVIRGDRFLPKLTHPKFSWRSLPKDIETPPWSSHESFVWSSYSLSGGTKLQQLTRRRQLIYSWWVLGDEHTVVYPYSWSTIVHGKQSSTMLPSQAEDRDAPQRIGAIVAEFPAWKLRATASADKEKASKS